MQLVAPPRQTEGTQAASMGIGLGLLSREELLSHHMPLHQQGAPHQHNHTACIGVGYKRMPSQVRVHNGNVQKPAVKALHTGITPDAGLRDQDNIEALG